MPPKKKPPKKVPAKKVPAKKVAKKRKTPVRSNTLGAKRTKILRAIGDAIPLRSACFAAGMGRTTLHEWKTKGKANLDAMDVWEVTAPEAREGKAPKLDEFGKFLIDCEAAEAKAESKLVRAVTRKTPLEILKRRFPKQWGDRKLVALEGTEDGPPIKSEGGPPVVVQLNFTDPDDEDLFEFKDGEDEEEEGGGS
jgi:hypothetical protein